MIKTKQYDIIHIRDYYPSKENPDPGSSKAPYKIYNIGNNSPVKLMDFIEAIEIKLGKKAKMNLM